MKNSELLLRGMLTYILLDLVSSSVGTVTEIVLLFVGLDFQVIIIIRGIIYLILLILIFNLLTNTIPFLIKITFKTFTTSVLFALLVKYISSYYRSEHIIIKLDHTIYFSNLVGIDHSISYSFTLLLIIVIISKFYRVTRVVN